MVQAARIAPGSVFSCRVGEATSLRIVVGDSSDRQNMDSIRASDNQAPVSTGSVVGDIARVILLAGVLLGSLWMLYSMSWLRSMTFGNVEHFRTWLTRWGGWSWAGFVIAGIALVSLGFPRVVLAAAGGAIFGLVLGGLLAQLATALAAAPVFYFTHLCGRDLVTRKLGNRLRRLDDLLGEHGFMVVLLIRLCPVGNNFIASYLAGITAIPFRTYISASFLGYLPETFIFALLGSGFIDHFHFRLWGSVGLFLTFSLFFIWYYRRSSLARSVLQLMRKE
jgi:uncharacterized membrane protein YdjX (TVP38/TMEM64 family)